MILVNNENLGQMNREVWLTQVMPTNMNSVWLPFEAPSKRITSISFCWVFYTVGTNVHHPNQETKFQLGFGFGLGLGRTDRTGLIRLQFTAVLVFSQRFSVFFGWLMSARDFLALFAHNTVIEKYSLLFFRLIYRTFVSILYIEELSQTTQRHSQARSDCIRWLRRTPAIHLYVLPSLVEPA